ncbi:MAG: HD domain-containing protein [Endomicrobia bacterium]|nr:HD domain-containing protein [Endomicrobiia bacterium]MCL2506781.1 HD domain-containing protein [Endomicrobiia bacterium]
MKNIIKTINDLSIGYKVYGVGGFVRDLLINRKPVDIDLAVDKNASKFASAIAKKFKSKVVTLDESNKIYRIMLKNEAVSNIDISLLDGKNIEEDLSRRDFTLNAFAFELKYFDSYKKHLISPNKTALKDLKSKTINMVSKEAFISDPLRMLRAFRFSAELGFKISENTLKQIKKNAALIKKSAGERIKNEFFRTLNSKSASKIILIMDNCGLLGEVFPEIKNMKKAPKKYYYHPGGLFQHSLETMSSVENITNNIDKYFPVSFKYMQEHFSNAEVYSENVNRINLLKFAALFHDSAKPETAKKDGDKMRFLGHDEIGAKKIEEIMKSLKMSKKDISAAVFLVKNHMRPSTLTRKNVVTQKASLKFFRDIGENTPDLLILSMADWHSYKNLKKFSRKELKAQEKSVNKMMDYYYELKNAKPLPKIIDGNIIMKKFGLKPGPWIGNLMKLVVEKQQEGEISDQKAALSLISSKLTQIKKKYKIKL